MATIEQKLWVLQKRCAAAEDKTTELTAFVSKVQAALRDPDVGPTLTGPDKQALLSRYIAKYAAAAAAQANVPADPSTFEPDPEEYEDMP